MAVRRLGSGYQKLKDLDEYGIRVRTRIFDEDGQLVHEVHVRNYTLFDAEVLTHFVLPGATRASYSEASYDQAYESLRARDWVRLWNLGDANDRQSRRADTRKLKSPDHDLEVLEVVALAEHPGYEKQSKTLYLNKNVYVDGV